MRRCVGRVRPSAAVTRQAWEDNRREATGVNHIAPFCHPRKLSAGIHPKKATRDARYTLSGMMKMTDPVCTAKAEGILPVSTCNMFVNHSTLPEKKIAQLLPFTSPFPFSLESGYRIPVLFSGNVGRDFSLS